MNITRNGILFITRREAISLVAYPDGLDKKTGLQRWSIGMGHNNDPRYPQGSVIVIRTAFALVKDDTSLRGADINRWTRGAQLTPAQFDALLSLYYQYGNNNNGVGLPMIQRICLLITAGSVSEAGLMFLQCDLDPTGKPSAGLLARRIAELRLFTLGDYADIGTVALFRGDPSTTKPESYSVQPDDLT